MKKRVSKKRLFLKILVALTVLSSMLVSTLFGVSKAEYFKLILKKFDFEEKPDSMFEYYLYDATLDSNKIPTGTYRWKKRYYYRKRRTPRFCLATRYKLWHNV